MWVGGLTELLRVASMAAAYDIPVIPHASGPYSYHFVVSQAHSPFQEYLANSPDGKSVLPVFGDLFTNEIVPTQGYINVSDLDKPGFGLEVNPNASLVEFTSFFVNPTPQKLLSVSQRPDKVEEEALGVNGHA
jgi:L-alanine-DL-glutamate epimerase-like enolase superfamily enzyme